MRAGAELRIAGVILVNRAGELLLQLRDGNTAIDAHKWCLPGGHVDDGEEPLAAAHRELAEETGLHADELHLFWHGRAPSGEFPGAVGEYTVFYAATAATDAEVICGEGAAMRFMPAATVPELEFGPAYARIVRLFLGSPEYRALLRAGTG